MNYPVFGFSNALAPKLVRGLTEIPESWALTPVRDKQPFRPNWQIEKTISRSELISLLEKGQTLWSEKKQKNWLCRWEGYGLRTGEPSGGIIAIDQDGSTAGELLNILSGGNLPNTVAWTSGKPGKRQLAYQLPHSLQAKLATHEFRRIVLKQSGEFKTAKDELLELRYTGVQSVLPPSKHPDTGEYKWINSPTAVEVAAAPQWLVDYLEDWCDQQSKHSAELAKTQTLKRQRFQELAQSESWDTHTLIQQALSLIPPRAIGGGNYDECRTVLMALCDFYGDIEAEAIAENWSPSIPRSSWNISQKIRSFRRSGVGIGSLFYIAKQYGFRFPDRQRTFTKPEKQEWFEPNHEDYQQREQAEAEAEQTAKAEEAERKRANSERYHAEVERIQTHFAQLDCVPTLYKSGYFIEPEWVNLPPQSGIILTNGGMGGRKTSVALKGLVEQHRALTGYGSTQLAFVPRRTLGKQASTVLDLPYRTEQGDGYINRGTLCFESIHLVDLTKLSDRPLILLDEVSQSFSQVLEGSTCKDSHAFVVNRMRALFAAVAKKGGWIVLSEDGLTNLELELVKEASGLEVVEYLDFQKIGHDRTLTLYNNPSKTWKEIQTRLFEWDQNLVVATDSRAWALQVYQKALDEGLTGDQVLLIEKGTISEPKQQLFSANPDEFIRLFPEIRLIIYTPTISSGVSLVDAGGHFDAVAFHITHLPARSAKQMLERLRSDVPRFGYATKRTAVANDVNLSAEHPDLLKKQLSRNKIGVEKLTGFVDYALKKDPESGQSLVDKLAEMATDQDDPSTDYGFFLKHWINYKTRENYEHKKIREQLIECWEKQGYEIEIVGGKDAGSKEERETIKGRLAFQESAIFAVLNTEDITLQEAREILGSENSKPDDRRKARKRLFEDKLPGCPLDDEAFVFRVLINDHSKILHCAERYWLRQNLEAAKIVDLWGWSSALDQAVKKNEWVSPNRLATRSAQAKLYGEAPLEPFIAGTVKEWGSKTPEAIALKVWALKNKDKLYRYCRKGVNEEQSPEAIVNKFLKDLGIQTEVSRKLGSRGNQKRLYRATNLESMDRELILQALSDRFSSRFAEKEGGSQDSLKLVPSQKMPTINLPKTEDEKETAQTIAKWLSTDSLTQIRKDWIASECEEERELFRQITPPRVLEIALFGLELS